MSESCKIFACSKLSWAASSSAISSRNRRYANEPGLPQSPHDICTQVLGDWLAIGVASTIGCLKPLGDDCEGIFGDRYPRWVFEGCFGFRTRSRVGIYSAKVAGTLGIYSAVGGCLGLWTWTWVGLYSVKGAGTLGIYSRVGGCFGSRTRSRVGLCRVKVAGALVDVDIYSAVGGCFGLRALIPSWFMSCRDAGRCGYILRGWRMLWFASLVPELVYIV